MSVRNVSAGLVRAAPGLIAALYCLSAYVRTLHPGLDYHDFGEMQFTSWVLGVPHGSGYPLYIWLGHIFERLVPISSPAHRLNLFSAVCGALSVFLIYAIVVRLSGPGWARRIGAAAAALLFGLSYTFWSIAIFAQMYTLHVALTLLVIWFSVRLVQERRTVWLVAALFTFGAMFGNHLCALSVGPGLALMVLTVDTRAWLSWLRPAIALGSFVAGFLMGNIIPFYLLWARHMPWDQFHASILANPDQFPDFAHGDSFWRCWWFVASTTQFQWALTPDPSWVPDQLGALPHRVVGELFPLGALGSLLGLVMLFRRNWRINLLLIGICATQTGLNLHYQNWKVPYYFAAPYACTAIWLGVLLAWVGGQFASVAEVWPTTWLKPFRTTLLATVLVGALALLATANVAAIAPYERWLKVHDPKSAELVHESFGNRPDQSHDTRAEAEATRLLEVIPEGALVLADWTQMFPLQYVAHVENRKPDVTILEAYPTPHGGGFTDWKRQFVEDEMKQRPVYLAGDVGGAQGGAYKLVQVVPGLHRFEPTAP